MIQVSRIQAVDFNLCGGRGGGVDTWVNRDRYGKESPHKRFRNRTQNGTQQKLSMKVELKDQA